MPRLMTSKGMLMQLRNRVSLRLGRQVEFKAGKRGYFETQGLGSFLEAARLPQPAALPPQRPAAFSLAAAVAAALLFGYFSIMALVLGYCLFTQHSL